MLKRLAAMLQAPARTERPAMCYKLAACVVLVEAASIDHDFTEEEQAHVLRVMQERFGLNAEEAAELMEASHDARAESSDLWKFTNQINQALSHPEKLALVEEVWRIFYSDGHLSAHEDHLAHKLLSLLNINHPQLIAAKMKVLAEIRGA
jgi:uncharacterized tellurite resistance protein B-like protein